MKAGDVVYLVKYGLSEGGAQRRTVRDVSECGSYVYLVGSFSFNSYKIGRDVFASELEAFAKLREMAREKVKSLRKQIERLETVKWKVIG